VLDGGAGEPVEELTRELLVLAGFEDDAGLLDGGVGVRWDGDEPAELAEVCARGDGERDEAGLGVAGLGELRGLADVFGDGEFGLELRIEAHVLKRLLRGEAVGRVRGVGDGEARESWRFQRVERDGLERGVVARPEDKDAVGVGRYGAERDASRDKLLRVGSVGGEKDILRSAVRELLGERGGGSERCDEMDAGGALVFGGEGGDHGLEIGGAGELKLLLCVQDGGEDGDDDGGEQSSAHIATVV